MLILSLLLWRMYDLTIYNRQFLKGQGNARSLRVIDIPGYRGMIIDRTGAPLAVSAPVKSLWVNPHEFSVNQQEIQQLAKLIGIQSKALKNKLNTYKDREFIYLKRHLTPETVEKLKKLNIIGLNFQDEYKRYYPESESIAHLIGFTDTDDNGIEGLELVYNDWLMGHSGKKRVLKDRLGAIVEELDIIKPPKQGNDLELTIDRRIQYFAYVQLKKTIEKFAAESGSVVVLDAKTGDILAIANAPSYNPNARFRYTIKDFRNKALTDAFEPGSVMKPFSIASALESKKFTINSVIDTYPGYMRVQGKVIRDLSNYGKLDLTGILKRSSNVGVSKILLQNPPDDLISLLENCGIGQRTEIAFPGEGNGTIVNRMDANPFVHATLGFGYGLSMTALQLAKSYLIFANKGKLIPITLLKAQNQSFVERKNVISEKTAAQVLQMMESVIQDTVKSAKVDGYRVAGKTGTARIAAKRGYHEDMHIASFVGIAPVTDPKLVIAVVIHKPSKLGYYANSVAAPLFSEVMSSSLHLLDIKPDQIGSA